MSLKAKIEAVIYAAEEPVTLQQLVGLLSEEAQAELDEQESRQASLLLEGSDDAAGEAAGDQDALNAELLDNPALEDDAVEASSAAGDVAGPEALAGAEADPSAALRDDKQGKRENNQELRVDVQEVRENEQDPQVDEQEARENKQDLQLDEQDVRADEQEALPSGEKGELPGSTSADPTAASAEDRKRARERERKLRDYFRLLLDRLMAEYANGDRGLEIREVAGGFRLATKPEYHDAVRGFVKSLKPPLKLSLQALETLAVIAYKQPVTVPEISEIRGVESGGVLGTLMARKLIGTAGRKPVIGRPMLYKTTREFLLRFGLKDINELPSIEEFERMAGELNDAVQEEIAMDDATPMGTSEITGGSPALNELDTTPASSDVAETAEDVPGKRDTGTEGTQTEPSAGVSQDAARAVEASADVHEAQADGIPDLDTPPTDTDAVDKHEPYTGNDERGA